jgi:hypothetical protein
VLDLSLELAQPQEVPMVEVSSAESLPQEVSSRRSSAENLYGGPNLPSKPVDDTLLLARTDDCHNASVATNGVNGTPSETSAFIERRPSKPSCDLASFLGKVSFNVDKKGNHRLSVASRPLLADFQMGHL